MRDLFSGAQMSGIVRQMGRGVESRRFAKVADIPQFFFLSALKHTLGVWWYILLHGAIE